MTAAAEPLLVVVGPTASGKTALCQRLAEQVGGEIINADSVQIYRHFDIGTGKPSESERARVAYHLLDSIDPLEPFDAAKWAELAASAIADIRDRGRVPIVCGGSFLWVRALVYGLAEAPAADEAVRARHRALAEERGRAALHAELARIDELSAERLSPNDFMRVSRALEVFELTGTPLSQWQAEHGFREERYRARLVGIRHDPAELDRRIAERTRVMLASGWSKEVSELLAAGYREARAMSSVGYRQLQARLDAGAATDGEDAFDEIRRATRVFARRQRTWLRDKDVRWLDSSEAASAHFEELLLSRL